MDIELLLYLATITLCLVISAFFSGSETAITAVSRARIYHLMMEGNARAAAVSKLRQQKERFIGGIMIGNNTVNILGSALATEFAIRHFGNEGVIYATAMMTLVVVIFGEVLPKTYAIQNSERMALYVVSPLSFILKLLQPVNVGLQAIVRVILRVSGADSNTPLTSSTDVIRGTIELHHQEGGVVKQDRDMLGSILDMDDIAVGDIMLHRLAMETIDAELPPDDIINLAVASTHSRIPLWQGDPENIIGVLHVKTLIKELRSKGGVLSAAELSRIVVMPWFIPETTSVREQLHAFRAKRQHLALVVDEYGALKGLVTLEDIMEEIVGRIDDEHDKHTTSEITPVDEHTFLVNGSMTIRDFNRELNWTLPDEEASTIAGLVIHEAELIPEVEESFEFYDTRFTVLEKQNNQITRLKIEKITRVDAEHA